MIRSAKRDRRPTLRAVLGRGHLGVALLAVGLAGLCVTACAPADPRRAVLPGAGDGAPGGLGRDRATAGEASTEVVKEVAADRMRPSGPRTPSSVPPGRDSRQAADLRVRRTAPDLLPVGVHGVARLRRRPVGHSPDR